MKTQHTPAPWTTDSSKSFYVLSSGEFVANASTEANARLISAAPDLLAALEKIAVGLSPQSVSVQSENLQELINSCFEIAREAIRKAKGE